ncbi:MAG: hypothetical protein EBT05_13885 [Betaproteobacteria bacterium]|nr:hypothetical protein [Betaproteobacteria bacterium]
MTARERSLAWLRSLQQPGTTAGVTRISAAHDAGRWPGMLLPGTYNAVMARELLGDIAPMLSSQREALADWLLSHRLADGRFRIPGMTDDTVYKKPALTDTWQYIDFHVSNYSLGAVQALCPQIPAELDFVTPWLAPLHLKGTGARGYGHHVRLA